MSNSYRKKPIIIQAWQSFDDCGNRTTEIPNFIIKGVTDQNIITKTDNGKNKTFIKTLEGDMLVSDGDWIIQGVKGELYPCKPEIFSATYEKV